MGGYHRRQPPKTDAPWERPDFDDPVSYEAQGAPSFVDVIQHRLWTGLTQLSMPFLRSKIEFQPEEEDAWMVDRCLGSGNFGTVGLWLKVAHEEIVDEVVLKQGNQDDDYAADSWYGLSNEAMIQRELNLQQCENITHLRAFKRRIDIENPHWRYYLEYAPYGDLMNLRNRYRYNNRYLPELFLWHVFNSLARVAVIFEACPDNGVARKINPAQFDEDTGQPLTADPWYIVHFDIKPHNIFLGYERMQQPDNNKGGLTEAQYSDYPTIKVGDFGIAEWTSQGDTDNPMRYFSTGTNFYKPPEQEFAARVASTWYGMTGAEGPGQSWCNSIFTEDEDLSNATPEPFGANMNVWSIGKVMYDLVSLSREEEYEYKSTNSYEQYLLLFDGRMMEDFQVDPFADDELLNVSPYSKELTDLIQRCLEARPEARIAARRLQDETREAMDRHFAAVATREPRDPSTVRNKKLYYVNNEIGAMSAVEKNCKLPVDAEDERDMLSYTKNDPDWPTLPKRRYGKLEKFDRRGWRGGANAAGIKKAKAAQSARQRAQKHRQIIVEGEDAEKQIRFDISPTSDHFGKRPYPTASGVQVVDQAQIAEEPVVPLQQPVRRSERLR